jgi:hypothetical protein
MPRMRKKAKLPTKTGLVCNRHPHGTKSERDLEDVKFFPDRDPDSEGGRFQVNWVRAVKRRLDLGSQTNHSRRQISPCDT